MRLGDPIDISKTTPQVPLVIVVTLRQFEHRYTANTKTLW